MTIHFYENNAMIRSGITLKDPTQLEENNMALHSCTDPQAILKNRQQLADALDIPLQSIVCAQQTHSANVHKVTRADAGKGAVASADAIPNTDALYTFEKNIALAAFTADCVPVTLIERESGLIGVIHSGWQGTIKEIAPHMLEQLKTAENIDLSKLHVQIGMALSQEKFEVDEDVYTLFKNLGYADEFIYYNEETKKYHIDNQLTVKKQFERAGVPSDQINVETRCTMQERSGFSYRQNKKDGRHLTFIVQN